MSKRNMLTFVASFFVSVGSVCAGEANGGDGGVKAGAARPVSLFDADDAARAAAATPSPTPPPSLRPRARR